MNVSDVKTRVQRQFGDEAGVQITADDILRWINDGQREVAQANTGVLEKIGTIDSVTNEEEYSLPADILVLRSLSYRQDTTVAYNKLKGLSLQDFDQYVDGWDGTNVYGPGIPEVFHVFASKIKLFPTPVLGVTAGIKVYYTRKPNALTADIDELDLPIGYHNRVVEYVMQQAYELDEDFNAASIKAAQFTTGLANLDKREQWTHQEFYPTVTVLPDDQDF